jgi:Domain of unknown function (DUF222)
MCSRGFAEGGLSVEEAFAALPAALDVLTSVPWWQLSDEQVTQAVVDFQRWESQVAAAQAGAVGEAINRGLPAEAGAKTPAVWLRGLTPVTPQAAKARTSLAAALHPRAGLGEPDPGQDLAPTREAFAAGTISPGHAAVVVRTMGALDDLPESLGDKTRREVQDLLVDTATRIDPAQLGRAGRRVVHRLDPEAAARLARDEDAQQRAREAYLFQEANGMWLLRGHLPPVAGAALAAALDPLAAPQPAADGTPDPRAAKHRTADALHTLAELSLAAGAGQPGALPTRGGSPTRLILTGDLETLTSRIDQPGLQPAVLDVGTPAGWELSPLAAQTLACDAEVVPILLDPTGRPLDVGDTMYPFPPKIRKAIAARDRHCTYPGCSAKPQWCHVHHLIPYRRSNWTAEANGALLCGHHHRHVHAHGWQGRIVDGHVVWRQPGSDEDIDNAHQQRFEQALRHLTLRWLDRKNDPARDRPDPDDTS